jgi:hypothetical protein
LDKQLHLPIERFKRSVDEDTTRFLAAWHLLTIHYSLFTIFKVQAVDCNFASLNPPHHLSQVRIFYLQRITDQRSGLSWY